MQLFRREPISQISVRGADITQQKGKVHVAITKMKRLKKNTCGPKSTYLCIGDYAKSIRYCIYHSDFVAPAWTARWECHSRSCRHILRKHIKQTHHAANIALNKLRIFITYYIDTQETRYTDPVPFYKIHATVTHETVKVADAVQKINIPLHLLLLK